VRFAASAGTLKSLTVIACVICAVAALVLSFRTNMEVSMFGFPDGYVTDYMKAAETPLRIATWVLAGFGALFLALAVLRIGTRARAVAWLAALIALVLVVAAAQRGVPWYFGTHLGLDNGIGG
jgi:hypothetical protein